MFALGWYSLSDKLETWRRFTIGNALSAAVKSQQNMIRIIVLIAEPKVSQLKVPL